MPQHIIEGSGAPGFTPAEVGQHYVDTSNKDEYFSTGTASSADWILRGAGGSLTVEEEGTPVDTDVSVIDFIGTAVTAAQTSPGEVSVTITGGGGGGVDVLDEGTPVASPANQLDFVGAGVSINQPVPGDVQVIIPGNRHPMTRSYLVDYSKDAAQAGKLDHMMESLDGGANWDRIDGGNSTAPGASGRLVYGTPTFYRESSGDGPFMFEWADQELGGTANRQNIRVFYRLNAPGTRWSTCALNENHQVNSGYALKGAAYDNAFCCGANAAGSPIILCQESGTNDYIRSSFDGGVSWTPFVIAGSLLTDLESPNFYVCEGGLIWAFGTNAFAFLQFDDGVSQFVRVYTSVDLTNWTTHYTSPTDTVWAGSTSPNYGRGQGVVLTPSLGFFMILGNQTTSQMETYQFPDAVSAPTITTMDATKVSGFSVASLPWQGGHGYTFDSSQNEVFFASGTLTGVDESFIVYTQDGITWGEGTFSGNDFNPRTQYGLEGYDGFSWVYEEQSGTPVNFMKNPYGGFAHPHGSLNNVARADGTNSGFVAFLDPSENAAGDSFMAIVENSA